MSQIKPDWATILLTAGIATLATTAAVAVLGKSENDSAASAINATSHILLGDEEAITDELDAKHTLTGAVINSAAMLSWAVFQDLLMGNWARKSKGNSLVAGTATSAIAYLVDYFVVPKRLTPGFEKRLSSKSMLATYAMLALGLAAGPALRSEK